MKKFFLSVFFYSGITVFLFTTFSRCTKNPEEADTTTVITSISHTAAGHGEIITIYGKYLLKDTSLFSVTINNKTAEVVQYTDDSLKVKVPEKAGSGIVVIHSGNKTFSGPEFTYNYEVIVSTIAGTGAIGQYDGPGTSASFYCPWGIVADDNGDLFIADTYNRLIRKFDASDQLVSTIQIPVLIGSENFYSPYNIAIDKRSRSLYVTDFNENLLKINRARDMDVIFTDLMPLTGIAIGPDDKLYISNNTTGSIIRIDTTGLNKTVFASGLITPRNIVFDHKNSMYVAAYGIYKFAANGSFSVAVNSNNFKGWEMAIDTAGNIYDADHFNNCIRKIDKNGNSTIIAGNGDAADVDGVGLNASFDGPQGITIDKEGNLYVTTFNYDTRTGNRVRKVSFR